MRFAEICERMQAGAKKFPEACKSQGDAEHLDTSRVIITNLDEALQKALHSVLKPIGHVAIANAVEASDMPVDVKVALLALLRG